MGGGKVPASGFALYLDRLMNLVKPGILARTRTQKILVRIESRKKDVLKEAFGIASSLREAGYIVQLDLGGQAPADLRWILGVQSKVPKFILWDKVESRKTEAQTSGEVLKLLEAEGADKDSLT